MRGVCSCLLLCRSEHEPRYARQFPRQGFPSRRSVALHQTRSILRMSKLSIPGGGWLVKNLKTIKPKGGLSRRAINGRTLAVLVTGIRDSQRTGEPLLSQAGEGFAVCRNLNVKRNMRWPLHRQLKTSVFLELSTLDYERLGFRRNFDSVRTVFQGIDSVAQLQGEGGIVHLPRGCEIVRTAEAPRP